MSRKLVIAFAAVSSLTAVASSALAGQTVSDGNYWPSEVAVSRLHLKTTPVKPLSAFGFDRSDRSRWAPQEAAKSMDRTRVALVPGEIVDN